MEPSSARIQDITADILSGIIDGVVVTDADGRVLIWNRAAEEMTGIAGQDALGRDVQDVFSENPAVVSQIEKTVSSGRSYSEYETEIAVKHGTHQPAGIVTSMLTDD